MTNNASITKFISENIIIDRFPVSSELQEGGKHGNCQVVINVSDEFYLGNSEQVMKAGKLNYYFPMGEDCENMGLHSIYGALQVLHSIYTWNPEWKVLLHCQDGKNRSPTVKSAFYYMMMNAHPMEVTHEGDVDMARMYNRLIYNCEKGHLHPLADMELFLRKCKFAFDNPEGFLGGMYDWVADGKEM